MNTFCHTNFQELCRACLRTLKENNLNGSTCDNITPGNVEDAETSSQLKSLLLPNLCKLFMLLTTYDVNNEDEEFPKRLCEWCYDRLVDYDKFRKVAIKSSKILYERWSAAQMEEVSLVEDNSSDGVDSQVTVIKKEDDQIDDDQLLLPELENMPINIKNELYFEAMETELILPSIAKENNTDQTSRETEKNDNPELIVPINFTENFTQSLNSDVEKNLNSNKDKSAKNLHCKYCNKKFYKEIYLEAHIRVTHKGQKKPFECTACNKAFTRLHLLTDHMQSNHREGFDSSEDHVDSSQENQLELSHFCYMCKRNYSSKRALREHIKRHKKIKEHVCQECGVAKVTRTELVTHMRTHAPNPEKFPCPLCSQVFNHKNAISRHVKVVHEGLRRYQCTYCPRRFGTRNSQIGHERLHTGERPFVCEICKKGFAQHEGLRSHMKNHDKNLRTHICKYCSRRFITLKNLKDHEQRHSSKKPHICNICNKGFSKYDELREHIFTHFEIGTDEDPEFILDTAVKIK